MQIKGQVQGASDAEAASDWNQDQNRLYAQANAETVLQEAESKVTLIREQGREIIGTQRAGYGSSGVTVGKGSSLALMADSARKIEEDIQIIKSNAAGKAKAIKFGADVSGFKTGLEGDMFSRRAKAGTISTLLKGSSSLYSQYGKGSEKTA